MVAKPPLRHARRRASACYELQPHRTTRPNDVLGRSSAEQNGMSSLLRSGVPGVASLASRGRPGERIRDSGVAGRGWGVVQLEDQLVYVAPPPVLARFVGTDKRMLGVRTPMGRCVAVG